MRELSINLIPTFAMFVLPAFAVLLAFLFVGLLVVMWAWALVDCLQGNFGGNDKVVWVLVIILVPLIGSILYFVIGRMQKIPPGGPR